MNRAENTLKYFEMYKDYTDARVKSGIELYRKGQAKIKLLNADKTPVKNSAVVIKQKNHEFRHGANIFLLGEFKDEQKEAEYRRKFAEIFNLATLPFYWDSLEPSEGKHRYGEDSPEIYRRPPIDRCLKYCAENGIEPKAHCLNYDHFTPKWAKGLSVCEFKQKLYKRFCELSKRYADRIPSWEVTNETFSIKGRTPTKFFYEDDFVEWSFKAADNLFPNNRLIINDYNMWDMTCGGVINKDACTCNRSAYYMQIERLIKNGVRLDTVGMQYHNFFTKEDEAIRACERYNPMHLYRVLDNYAKLGRRIQITEMTIPAYTDSPDDEQLQAELLKNIYSIMFSHPAMEAIIYWNLVDGYAYTKEAVGRESIGDMSSGENVYRGGLLRFDMSEKPAFAVLKDLFSNQWHTQLTAYTSDDGSIEFRGFYGDYDLEIHANDKTAVSYTHLTLPTNSRV